MFVLGVDPGLTRCGFGLVEGSLEGPERFRAVRAGVLATDPSLEVEERLGRLYCEFSALLDDYAPDAVVVERVFFQRNVKTAIPVAQASGVVIALAAGRGIAVRQFTPQEVKVAVTGYGGANKVQVQSMVAQLCVLREVPQPADAADALALAITYLATERTQRRSAVAS